MSRKYFLVNDTRYDNHHGCLSVVKNLHQGMSERGWSCSGSLPVSSSPSSLKKYASALAKAEMVIINGEGSLHHDSRNANRLFEICRQLSATHQLVLVNALWQANDIEKWAPVLTKMKAIYTRDRRSQNELTSQGIAAKYAPDLTFYQYPTFFHVEKIGYGCTDSVLNIWSENAFSYCQKNNDVDFLTLFTGNLAFSRGSKDWMKRIKYRVYPVLWKWFKLRVPPRYKSIGFAINDTTDFLSKLSEYKSVCVARYHALCFAVQQGVPFLIVSSNSHKSEALLEEIGLPVEQFSISKNELNRLKARLIEVAEVFPEYHKKIDTFNVMAKTKINQMLDEIAF